MVRRAVQRTRARTAGADGEAGMTLVELITTVALLSVVLSILLTILVSVQNNLVRQSARSTSNDQARLAVQQLDREIRSGNVLYKPSLENDAAHYVYPGMSLRIYTQANAPTREAGGNPGARCVQWRIKKNAAKGQYELQRREWVKDATTSTNWQVIAENVMNRSVSPNQAAFSVDPDRRIVSIAILANKDNTKGGNVLVETTVEGRNTIYNFPDEVCANIPTYPTPDPAES